MVGGGGYKKLVGQTLCILGYVGDAGYMGDQYQARLSLGRGTDICVHIQSGVGSHRPKANLPQKWHFSKLYH